MTDPKMQTINEIKPVALCPICRSTKQHCREIKGENVVLCVQDANPGDVMTLSTGVVVCRGRVKKNQRWLRWTPVSKNNTTPVSVRHDNNRRILAELKLLEEDRQSFIARGFTDEEIRQFCPRSVSQWQQLSFELPDGFPGIGRASNSLGVSLGGFLCPIPSYDRKVMGFQIRSRDKTETNKYRWVSTRNGCSNLESGEQPLAFYWPEGTPKMVCLVEGVGPKPFLVSRRLEALTIGAAGGLWGSGATQILSAIKSLQSDFPDLPWALAPDSGAYENPDVYREMRKISDLLAAEGIPLHFKWWGQAEKRDGFDSDEIPAERLQSAQLLTAEEYFDKAPPEVVEAYEKSQGSTESEASTKAILKLLSGVSGLELEIQVQARAKELQLSPVALRRLVDDYNREAEEGLLESEQVSEIALLRDCKELTGLIDIQDYVHPNLAGPLLKIAENMSRKPYLYVHSLLPVIASLVPAESTTTVNRSMDFAQPIIINALVVAKTGEKKSPLFNVVMNPIRKLQAETDEAHSSSMKDWAKAVVEAKRDKSLEPPEPPGSPKEWLVSDFTMEAIVKIFGDQPEKGFVAFVDEAKRLVSGFDAYRNGLGGDKEAFLEFFNGTGHKKNRTGDDSRVSVETSHINVLGGIQPSVLQELVSRNGGEDSQGFFARFLILPMNAGPGTMPDQDAEKWTPGPFLEGVYRLASRLNVQEYELSPEAYAVYRDYYDRIEQAVFSEEVNPIVIAATAKAQGYAVRLATAFHILWEIASGENIIDVANEKIEIPTQIPVDRIICGINWIEMCLGQVRLMAAESGVNGDKTGLKLAVVELLSTLDDNKGAKVGFIRNRIWKLRTLSSGQVSTMLGRMVAQGLLDSKGSKRATIYSLPSA